MPDRARGKALAFRWGTAGPVWPAGRRPAGWTSTSMNQKRDIRPALRTHERVQEEHIVPAVIVSDSERDANHGHAGHHDPPDCAQVASEPFAPGPGQMEAGKVVAGQSHQHVRGAFPGEELDVRGDDENDGHGAQHDPRLHPGKQVPAQLQRTVRPTVLPAGIRSPSAGRRAGVSGAGDKFANGHQVPPLRKAAQCALKADRRRDVGERISAKGNKRCPWSAMSAAFQNICEESPAQHCAVVVSRNGKLCMGRQ